MGVVGLFRSRGGSAFFFRALRARWVLGCSALAVVPHFFFRVLRTRWVLGCSALAVVPHFFFRVGCWVVPLSRRFRIFSFASFGRVGCLGCSALAVVPHFFFRDLRTRWVFVLSSPSFVWVGHWVWPYRFRGGFADYTFGASLWLGGLSKQKDR